MDKKYSLWLIMTLGAGEPLINELLSRFGTAEAVYLAFRENRALAGAEAAERAAAVNISDAQELQENLEARGIHILTRDDMYFPKLLKSIENPPSVLFARGNCRVLSGRLLSFAGARDITDHTIDAGEKLCASLYRRYTPVSTLSRGCDELTCICALRNSRAFVEIMPCGFDNEYPEGSRLMRELVLRSGGCVLSEYLPGTRAGLGTFRRRARLIGGISRALVILQAGIKSGSLAAAGQSGNVFFLPPRDVFDKHYAGTAAFVRAGARFIFGAEDLSPVYDGEYLPKRPEVKPATVKKKEPAGQEPAGQELAGRELTEQKPVGQEPAGQELSAEMFDSERHFAVYKRIADSAQPPAFDQIFGGMSCDIAEMNEILLDLELSGYIRPLAGGRYTVGT